MKTGVMLAVFAVVVLTTGAAYHEGKPDKMGMPSMRAIPQYTDAWGKYIEGCRTQYKFLRHEDLVSCNEEADKVLRKAYYSRQNMPAFPANHEQGGV